MDSLRATGKSVNSIRVSLSAPASSPLGEEGWDEGDRRHFLPPHLDPPPLRGGEEPRGVSLFPRFPFHYPHFLMLEFQYD